MQALSGRGVRQSLQGAGEVCTFTGGPRLPELLLSRKTWLCMLRREAANQQSNREVESRWLGGFCLQLS